ncbi:hypothetical protein [Pseudomonas oryzihabitans]|jgi:hypothetical protein|uniref:hypothetical protein n=1 Tax=Pseudomonas oryzihabitans TaxID=47885 RepID=UPI002866FB19|nr:hypothetical protein [Pseudomonas psychrotolerans]MDR6679043.1 hypothetical protein [Pseudomonas psychrotolerans]
MITRLPSATASPLTYDVCPLGADSPSLSIDILRQGFLALDNHLQLAVGREIKHQLRERLIADLNAQPVDTTALAVEAEETPPVAATPRRERQTRLSGG